ncbi:DUF4347 domain-containing protein [Pyxidicoccus sp. 3LG]
MATHLTVVSYKEKMEPLFSSIYRLLDEDPSHRFEFCQDWRELPELILRAGFNVDLLDLVGHGSPGFFELGDKTFIENGALTDAQAKMFRSFDSIPLLPKHAEIRFLGCETGANEIGLKLLKSLSKEVGGRKVSGTIVELLSTDFSNWGLTTEFASRWLVTSRDNEATPAADRFAPPKGEPVVVAPHHPSEPPPRAEKVRRAAAGAPIAESGLAAFAGPPQALLELDGVSASGWAKFLPGYQLAGRGEPITSIDLDFRYRGVGVTFSGNRRLVMIKDDPRLPSLMFRWSDTGPVPTRDQLLVPFRAP